MKKFFSRGKKWREDLGYETWVSHKGKIALIVFWIKFGRPPGGRSGIWVENATNKDLMNIFKITLNRIKNYFVSGTYKKRFPDKEPNDFVIKISYSSKILPKMREYKELALNGEKIKIIFEDYSKIYKKSLRKK